MWCVRCGLVRALSLCPRLAVAVVALTAPAAPALLCSLPQPLSMSHSPDSDGDVAPQFHEPAPSPMAAAAATAATATNASAAAAPATPVPASAAASGAPAAPASASASTESDRPVVRVHGLEQAEQESGVAPASLASSSSPHVTADSAAAAPPVLPAPSSPAAADAADATAPASLPNGVHPISSNGAASSSSSSGISTASNPSSPAVAAALWPIVTQFCANTNASVVPSLDTVLAVIQSLPFEARANVCSAASAAPPASSAAAASAFSPSSAVFSALLNYFLDDAHSGSAQDGLCKFLYEIYWEASTKLGHEPVAANRNNNAVAASSSSAPPAHLFLLNLLPVLIFKFVQKHFDASSATAGGAADSASSSYAGLFTVFLAVYNTERILAARAGNGGILAPKPVPTSATLPELEGVVPFAAPATTASPGLVKPVSNTQQPTQPPTVQAKSVLPAINEPTSAHVMLLLHVLLLKHHSLFPRLMPQSREGLVLLAGLATTSGLLGTPDPFEGVERIARGEALRHGAHHRHHAAAVGGATTAPVQTLQTPQAATVPVTGQWNRSWVSTSSAGVPPVRYLLTSSLLQDFLLGIEFVLKQARADESAGAASRAFALVALRQVHCRALEEMMPEVLLQTTCMLQQEEDDTQRH